MEGAKATPSVRKSKKKQVKDEFDRIKQAEKKKRRLEKALATSAAIRSELEKKKQRKKEEQERLDEEGAAIAEAVALHVLIGEDSDDSSKIMMNNDQGISSWDRSVNTGVIMGTRQPQLVVPPRRDSSMYSLENIGFRVRDAHQHDQPWNNHLDNSNSMVWANNRASRDLYPMYLGPESWDSISFLAADHIAAQCVASLSIADDARRDAYMFNHVLRGW